jgi:hypothetical protein
VDSVDFRKKVFILHHHLPLLIHHSSFFIFQFSISTAVLLLFHSFFIFHSIIFHSFFRLFEKKSYLCAVEATNAGKKSYGGRRHDILKSDTNALVLFDVDTTMENNYIIDDLFGERLLISVEADQRELSSNIRAARSILSSYSEVSIVINPHRMVFGHKNPEYLISNQLGDRKGIVGEKGVTAGFKSAKKQGCKVVVIDLDEHIMQVRPFELSKYIARRKADFVNELITDCYVVFCGQAVRVNARYQTRREIEMKIEMLGP